MSGAFAYGSTSLAAESMVCPPGFDCKISSESVSKTHPGFTPEMPTASITVSEVSDVRLEGLNPNERLCPVKCPVSVENPEGGQVTGCYEICRPIGEVQNVAQRAYQPVAPRPQTVSQTVSHRKIVVPPQIRHVVVPEYYNAGPRPQPIVQQPVVQYAVQPAYVVAPTYVVAAPVYAMAGTMAYMPCVQTC